MIRQLNWMLSGFLMMAFVIGMTTNGLSQSDRPATKRSRVESKEDKKKTTRGRSVIGAKKRSNDDDKKVVRRNSGNRNSEARQRNDRSRNRDTRQRNERRRNNDGVRNDKPQQRNDRHTRYDRNQDRRDNRDARNNRNNRGRDNRNGRIDRNRHRDHNRGKNHDRSRRFENRHHDRDRGYHHYDWRKDYRRYRWNHPYWKKHHRPRKKYYYRYGWSPFFSLTLRPSIRFSTYTRPLIRSNSHIVYTKEYDSYDYVPGDPIGYAVHISFNGRVRVYDRYYDQSPELVDEYYISHRKLRRLERILDRGRYYDYEHCLLDEYGDDDHPGYATIGYRTSRYRPMRTVSLNLSAPRRHQPEYFVDFNEEIEEMLYDRGFFQ